MAATGTSTADEGQIRAVIAGRVTAMRERDAERFVAHYAPQIVKFDLAPPLVYAGPQARDPEGLRAWFASHPGGPVGYEIRDLTVTVGGDVAFCHSLNHLGGALWFRSTLGLRKTDGGWRVTHEHNSTPFYMDGSDKAALDLRPSQRHERPRCVGRPDLNCRPTGDSAAEARRGPPLSGHEHGATPRQGARGRWGRPLTGRQVAEDLCRRQRCRT